MTAEHDPRFYFPANAFEPAPPAVSEPAPAPAPASAPAQAARSDQDLRNLDLEAAITRGLMRDGAARRALFTEGAIAASWQAQDLGIGPYPLAFLARCVRGMGVSAALDLPEPLIGAAPTRLARDWMAAAATVAVTGQPFARDDLFASWIDLVAALIATRRSTSDPAWVRGRVRPESREASR